MSIEIKKLGQILTLKRGYDLSISTRTEGAVPVVSSSGITGFHNESKVRGPGVVTGRYGTIGEVYYVQEDYWPLNTALYVQDFKGHDPRFIYYYLMHILKGTQSDKASVPGVNRNDLHAREVRIPSEPSHTRIAGILSAYDDLIENNRRRIQLLEQAARLIYQEWFVRLRYPGHERVRVVDGVPEGWEKRKLGGILVLNYGKGLKESERIKGDVPVYGSSGVVGSHHQHLVEGPGIVVGRKGNVGSIFWSQSAFFPIDTVYYVDSETSSLYLFHLLQSLPFQSSDGAVPGLNRNYAYSLPVRVPPKTLVDRFEGIASPIYQQILNLQRQNERLRQARDLLLPRLMSGEIAV
jgi:type I restriction enzyme S subunit